MIDPTTAIFIRSYKADFPWLNYALRSLSKFATGFTEIIVQVPEQDVPLLNHLTVETVIGCHNGQPGYLCQQKDKLCSDFHTRADCILHWDSDMCANAPFYRGMFFKDGKPIWVVTPFDEAPQDEKKAWLHVLVKCLREMPPFEFMRKCAIIAPRWLYEDFRKFIERVHGMSLESYVMNQPGHEFSEYNCLGFYAWLYHRDKFHWHNTATDGVPTWPWKQYWSYSGLKPEERAEMEGFLK